MTHPLTDIEQIGLQAVRAAVDIFHLQNPIQIIKSKSHQEDIVTTTDISMETAILDTVKSKFPHHGFDTEEAGIINPQANYVWVIDPLDGTKNLKRGIPLISTSLSCRHGSQTLFAAVAIHTWNLTIHGTLDKGVFRDNQPVHVSDTSELNNAFIYAELPTPWAKKPTPEARLTHNLELFNRLTRSCYRLRAFGSGPIGLALTAVGAFDAYINLYQASDPGDIEPGKFLVEQAGGQTSSITGEPYQSSQLTELLASNGKIHQDLLKVIND